MTDLQFRLDKTGFPMVWVDAIDAYIHWIPATKIQFEYFLSAAPDSHFDAAWYDEILNLNPRISPGHMRLDNYWKAFLSGIRPAEVLRFARWNGEGYQIPSLDEWFSAYKSLKTMLPETDALAQMGELEARVKKLLTRLNDISRRVISELNYEWTLADQMLMRMGVMEWVESQNQRYRWGGMGETYPKFRSNLFIPDHGQPSVPNNPEQSRLSYYGFRLLWRPA